MEADRAAGGQPVIGASVRVPAAVGHMEELRQLLSVSGIASKIFLETADGQRTCDVEVAG